MKIKYSIKTEIVNLNEIRVGIRFENEEEYLNLQNILHELYPGINSSHADSYPLYNFVGGQGASNLHINKCGESQLKLVLETPTRLKYKIFTLQKFKEGIEQGWIKKGI